MYLCMYVCIYACMYVCIYACTYVCIDASLSGGILPNDVNLSVNNNHSMYEYMYGCML